MSSPGVPFRRAGHSCESVMQRSAARPTGKTVANFWNVFQIAELRRKLIFTVMMVGVYRLGIFISVPGVDSEELRRAFQSLSGTLFGLANMFSGGAFEQASIFALGIMPYISASIIIQLCTAAIPTLERLSKEGEAGRRKITQYTRYGTILLSVIQGFGVSNYLAQGIGGMVIVEDPDMTFYFVTVLTLTAGTTFVMWLGEQITERGVGNGISLIIFSSIVAQAPAAARDWYQAVTSGNIEPIPAMVLLFTFLGVIAVIVFFEQAQRRIPIQYARRLTGKSVAAGQTSHLPLKVNVSGVIPPIFASSLLMLPATISSLVTSDTLEELNNLFSFDSWLYNTVYVGLIIFFCYFYTSVTFNPSDVADNLKKSGGSIPGIRPGKATAEYIDFVLSRITFGGAIYLSTVCVLPTFFQQSYNVPPTVAMLFGGTSLMIIVGVALDMVRQIESHLITRRYDGFVDQGDTRIRDRQEVAS